MLTLYSDELSKHLDFWYDFILSSAFPLMNWKLRSGQTITAQIVIRAHFSDPAYFHGGTYYEVDYVNPDETQKVKVCTETIESV